MTRKKISETDAMQIAYDALADLQKDEQTRAIIWLQNKLNVTAQPTATQSTIPSALLGNQIQSQKPDLTPKMFLAQKKPTSDVERVTCLAYYLAHYRDNKHFKTIDITTLNKEAAQPKFSNTAVPVDNATKSQYLTPVGGGKKQITSYGEALVEALPDREKVKTALDEYPIQKRRKSGRKQGRKTDSK